MSANWDRSGATDTRTTRPRHSLGLRLVHDPRPDHDPTKHVLWLDGHHGEFLVQHEVDALIQDLQAHRPNIVTD